MSQKSSKTEQRDGDGSANDLVGFLSDLTRISVKHRLGISDDAELFIMEAEDLCFSYACDEDGRLQRL